MTRTRVLTALLIAPLAIAAVLWLPTPWLVALTAIAFLGALWEWLRLAGIDDSLSRGLLLLANLLMMAALVWASPGDSGGALVLFKLASVVGVLWWLLVMLWLKQPAAVPEHGPHACVIKLAAGTLAIVPAWCSLALIHASDSSPSALPLVPEGHLWLLLALMVVWAADTGAYFAGRRFGKRKLAPVISPNKTVEGMAGGLLAGVAVAVLLAPLAGASMAELPLVALVALLAAMFSVFGDLFESLLKRQAGVKDSGSLLPGHGGILDRVDGVLAALPVFAVGKVWLGF